MSAPSPNPPDEVPVRELTHHTSQILARVKAGETLTITERGEPIAAVIPLRRSRGPRPATGYADSGDPQWAVRASQEMRGFGE
ncbi:type II toxin-antitoxin system Phd/YefM family antitoxin [Nocardia crassostreae]|uniref:type II toxin-antitoxin system Phd/YefM family antitoxin n=1 Tax=Nocardia crassostreae TaxID=53428 RepID=UPI0009FC46A7|nr:type II toxin-antitoxin system prevent-host-death family antitoxin [Nocardia crassostreae]